jgi:large subunit ribosomal protein L21
MPVFPSEVASMYAVIRSGGKQLRVQVGDEVRIERLAAEVGAPVVFDQVLMLGGDDDRVRLGAPLLDGAQVRGTVVAQGRGPRIVIYTYKKTQNSNRRRQGHRQKITTVKIDAIEA